MLKEAIDRIVGLALAPTVSEIDGRRFYVTPAGAHVQEVKDEEPACLAVSQLRAIVDFLRDVKDKGIASKTGRFIHVHSPASVTVYTEADVHQDRIALLEAIFKAPLALNSGSWYDQESFVIGLQACFVTSTDRTRLLSLAGTVKGEASTQGSDDGVTQVVATRNGAVLSVETVVNNPFMLAPRRTFPEVEQPASPFVLRLKNNGPDKVPSLGLFLADGGAWELEAVANIAKWLRAALKEAQIVCPVLA